MTAPRVTLATFDAVELLRVLEQASPKLRYLYLESDIRIALARFSDYFGAERRLLPIQWSIGRAFGPALEIRWRRDELVIDAQALAEDDSAPPGWSASEWNTRLDPAVQARNVLLAGINSIALPPEHILHDAQPAGGLWISDSIASPLHYPADDPRATRLILRCLDYLCGGMVVLTRLCDLATYDERR